MRQPVCQLAVGVPTKGQNPPDVGLSDSATRSGGRTQCCGLCLPWPWAGPCSAGTGAGDATAGGAAATSEAFVVRDAPAEPVDLVPELGGSRVGEAEPGAG